MICLLCFRCDEGCEGSPATAWHDGLADVGFVPAYADLAKELRASLAVFLRRQSRLSP